MSYTHEITLKLTAEQYRWLEDAADQFEAATGSRPSHGTLMMKLCEAGLPGIERELLLLRAGIGRRTPIPARPRLVWSTPVRDGTPPSGEDLGG